MTQYTTKISDLPAGNIGLKELAGDITKLTQQNGPRASHNAHQKTKSFPIDILPPKVQRLVKEAKKALGIPEDFLAVAILSAASSAVGNTYRLEIKKGVEQKGIFYMVIVGLPNSNKSGALSFAMKPLFNRDKVNFEAYQAQSAAWEAEQAKPKQEQEEIEKPIFERVTMGDATPEAVASALADSPRGMLLCRDELAGFIKDFNRYHQGGELEFWLSNWSGMHVSIDRKNSEPIRIRNPFLSIIGTIQPGTIEALAKGTKAVNGFIDRFLFCWPEGLTKPEWTEENIDPLLVNEYEEAINRMLDLKFNEDHKAHLLTLTDKARKLLFQFFNTDNKRLCDEAENEMLAGIYGKFDLHASRFIIGLHLLQWAYSGKGNIPLQIEPETVAKAIKIAEYFRNQALKVYKAIHHTSPVEKLPADKRKLYEALPEAFKKGDGIKIADKLNITPKTFSRFLQERQLFEKIRHGEYGKIY